MYSPFGSRVAGPVSELGFSGADTDSATSLVDLGSRQYGAEIGRFYGFDSVGFSVQNPQSFNRYAYAYNNPSRYVDPTGDIPIETIWDVYNVGSGAYSLGANLLAGNFIAAAIDAGGLVLDIGATAVPYVPGGAAAAIRAKRAADLAIESARATVGSARLAGEAARGSTPLYRAVRQGELDDIIEASGAFKNPLGIENKYFSTTAEGAASYARQASRAFHEGPFTIVETRFPTSAITPAMRAVVDRGIPTVTVPTEALNLLSAPRIWNYAPIPK